MRSTQNNDSDLLLHNNKTRYDPVSLSIMFANTLSIDLLLVINMLFSTKIIANNKVKMD